ncbi:hypothetical protein ASF21_13420 [Arthrobacter sp. Leaf234]|uniref:muramidase family protein n=1 Tax=Arthrobacter sp. Leaf234 TaxID=1736303 RepID=UPI0006F518C9|nr:LysM peptidoglycan-binding domain-containing protein [Arthrobacter sp. Leaf234]KQN99782.1 hypothetical protein ASF21_13420 [Arthrobacter sp. Leaf234]
MTAQRSNAPLNGTRRKATGASARGLNVAVTTAALPAVILSSVALAQPATAAPAQVAPAMRHLGTPAVSLPSRTLVPAALVAVQVPAQRIAIAAQPVPAEYTVKPGDTIGAIAKRHGLSTDSLLTLNRMNARTIIYPGQKITLGGKAGAEKPAPSAPAAPAVKTTGSTYVVKPGDTLGAIASRAGVSLQSLLTDNKLSMTSIIYPGQKLTIGGKGAAPAPAPGKPAPAPAPSPAPAPQAGSYTVKGGDTLGAIASRHGVSLQALLAANKMSMTTIIYPGQKLTIPGKGAAPAPAPAPAPSDLVPHASPVPG